MNPDLHIYPLPDAATAGTSTHPLIIAGFWRRVFADLIDMVILAICLFVLGVVFQSFFYASGPYGRIYGFGIVVAYLATGH